MTREHGLPPYWDGLPVLWGAWRGDTPFIMCGRAPVQSPCHSCGLIRPRALARGYTATSPLATHETLRRRRDEIAAYRPGYGMPLPRPLGFYRLTAFRCTHCGADSVYDHDTGQSWDLDDTDYGDGGSCEDGLVQGR